MNDIFLTQTTNIPLAKKRFRVFASLIDYTLCFVFFFIIGATLGEQYTPPEGGIGFRLTGMQPLICMGFWFIIMPVMEAIQGQTFGKMIMNIRVVSKNYSDPSFGQTLVRHLFDFVDWFPFFGVVGLLVASNNQLKQRVGDLVAKTIVITK